MDNANQSFHFSQTPCSFPQAHASLECLPTNHEAGHIAAVLSFYLFFEWDWVWACFPDWIRTRACQGSSCLSLLSDGGVCLYLHIYIPPSLLSSQLILQLWFLQERKTVRKGNWGGGTSLFTYQVLSVTLFWLSSVFCHAGLYWLLLWFLYSVLESHPWPL